MESSPNESKKWPVTPLNVRDAQLGANESEMESTSLRYAPVEGINTEEVGKRRDSMNQEDIDLDHPSVQLAIENAVQHAINKISLNSRPVVELENSKFTKSFLRPRQQSYAPRKPSIADGEDNFNRPRAQIRYPPKFSDNEGEVDFEAWKMEMMIMIEDYNMEFGTIEKQIRAYFRCTSGRAQEILMERMSGPDRWDSTEQLVQALDEEFFDYNREARAREDYYNLRMQVGETYQSFRQKFRRLATRGRIPRQSWFEDVCSKITPVFRRDIKGEKFRMNEDYVRLDEFLQYLDRENVAIKQDSRSRVAKPSPILHSAARPPQILKRSPTSDASSSFQTEGRSHAISGSRSSISPRNAIPLCYGCNRQGHIKKDCPDIISAEVINNIDAGEVDEDELSENC